MDTDPSRFPRLRHVGVDLRNLEVTVRVTLEAGGRSLVGEADALATQPGRLRASAQATLRALEPLIPDRTRLGVEDIVVLSEAGDWVAVHLILLDNRGSARSVGTAPTEMGLEASVVRASLDAIDRLFELPVGRLELASADLHDAIAEETDPETTPSIGDARTTVAVVSHQLRAPLTVMNEALETIQNRWDQLDEATKKQLVEVGTRQARVLLERLDVLLEAMSGGPESPRATPIIETLDEALLGLDIEREHVQVRAPDGPSALVVPGHLEEILRNLIDNAFTHGAPPVDVVVRSEGNTVTVCVEDHGHGVPPAEEPDLFEDTHGARRSGHGIGLYIVRLLVELNGGRVWHESVRPRGARFCFEVPAG